MNGERNRECVRESDNKFELLIYDLTNEKYIRTIQSNQVGKKTWARLQDFGETNVKRRTKKGFEKASGYDKNGSRKKNDFYSKQKKYSTHTQI